MAQQVTLLAWHSRLARTFHLSNASLLGSGLTLMQTSQAHECAFVFQRCRGPKVSDCSHKSYESYLLPKRCLPSSAEATEGELPPGAQG